MRVEVLATTSGVSEDSITNAIDITKIFQIGYAGGRTLDSHDLQMSNNDGISCKNSCQNLKFGDVRLTLMSSTLKPFKLKTEGKISFSEVTCCGSFE